MLICRNFYSNTCYSQAATKLFFLAGTLVIIRSTFLKEDSLQIWLTACNGSICKPLIDLYYWYPSISFYSSPLHFVCINRKTKTALDSFVSSITRTKDPSQAKLSKPVLKIGDKRKKSYYSAASKAISATKPSSSFWFVHQILFFSMRMTDLVHRLVFIAITLQNYNSYKSSVGMKNRGSNTAPDLSTAPADLLKRTWQHCEAQ